MSYFIWIFAAIYMVGFLLFFAVNLAIGPVTPSLAFVRALVWPIWITTGWPNGVRF